MVSSYQEPHPAQALWCVAGTGHLEMTDLAWGLPGSSAVAPRVGSSPCSPIQTQVPVELGLWDLPLGRSSCQLQCMVRDSPLTCKATFYLQPHSPALGPRGPGATWDEAEL